MELYEKAFYLLEHNKLTLGQYKEMIEPLNTEIREWTPCSEGLPKKDGRYWISTKTITCEDNFENGEFVFYRSNVIAWMPLPKPYKEEGE